MANGVWRSEDYAGSSPGMIFDGEDFSGTPFDAGNWLLQVRIFEPECNGVYADRIFGLIFQLKVIVSGATRLFGFELPEPLTKV